MRRRSLSRRLLSRQKMYLMWAASLGVAMSLLSCRIWTPNAPGEEPTPEPTSTPAVQPSPSPTAAPAYTPTPETAAKPSPSPETGPTAEPPGDTTTIGPFRSVIAVSELLPGAVVHLATSSDGSLWLGTDQGVARIQDGTPTVYLSGYAGTLAGVDDVGRVWVVSEDTSEISAWDGAAWTGYGAGAGWTPIAHWTWSPVERGLFTDTLGRLWLATGQDVRVFDGQRWTVFTMEAIGMRAPEYEDTSVAFEIAILKGLDEIWVGECEWLGPGPVGGQGVRRFDGEAWHEVDPQVSSGCVEAITEDPSGMVWFGVGADLWRYDQGSGDSARFSPPPDPPVDGMRHGPVLDIGLDPSGNIWPTLMLCGGASCDREMYYRVRDGAWTPIGEEILWGIQVVVDAAGTPWIFGWEGNVHRIAADVPELAAEMNAQIVRVTMDAIGRVWFVTRSGDQDVLWASG